MVSVCCMVVGMVMVGMSVVGRAPFIKVCMGIILSSHRVRTVF